MCASWLSPFTRVRAASSLVTECIALSTSLMQFFQSYFFLVWFTCEKLKGKTRQAQCWSSKICFDDFAVLSFFNTSYPFDNEGKNTQFEIFAPGKSNSVASSCSFSWKTVQMPLMINRYLIEIIKQKAVSKNIWQARLPLYMCGLKPWEDTLFDSSSFIAKT